MKIVCQAFLLLSLTFLTVSLKSQEAVKLWDDATIAANGEDRPEIFIHQAKDNPNGKAIVICPGGAYVHLSMNYEGHDVAKWLSEKGITGVVLKYRMPKKERKDVPLDDVKAAIRYVRDNAEQLGVDKDKVGVMGFSAGGHLASSLSTHYNTDVTNTRPNFSVLFYPVISMGAITHEGSKINLLGEKPSVTDVYRYSNENQVSVNTPPTLLLLSDDDKIVVPENSICYYESLKKNGIPSAMYIFPEGGHGWGFNTNFKYHDQMKDLLEMWLNDLSL